MYFQVVPLRKGLGWLCLNNSLRKRLQLCASIQTQTQPKSFLGKVVLFSTHILVTSAISKVHKIVGGYLFVFYFVFQKLFPTQVEIPVVKMDV